MTTVHTTLDYRLRVQGAPPEGYPRDPRPDPFSTEPFAPGYADRRRAILDHCLHNPSPGTNKAPYYELVRMEAGGIPHLGVFHAALDYIDQRKDCADFVLHSILRLLYQFPAAVARQPGGSELLARARETVLSFKYWPDEPGIDSMCTWTENHQILFACGAYLAGQLFPHAVFPNAGDTGQEKMSRFRPRILRWLDLRFRTGFSEWLSHVYYDEDITALVTLVDFCQDGELAQRAQMVTDLMLADMALNSFRGVFGSTHGRSYENAKKWAAQEGTTDTHKLVFGTGIFSGFDNMSAACLALSPRYRLPQVIAGIPDEQGAEVIENRQRMGIRLAEAERWGLGFSDFEDGMVHLSLEAYAHPRTVNLTMDMFSAYQWWENRFFAPFKARERLVKLLRRFGLLPWLARLAEKDITRNTREEVNLYTYRTPDYSLSTAQDHRPGYGGDQQHIWQATLAPDVVCFTTHPAKLSGPSPSYWTGSGTLPRAAQVENVVIAVYKIDPRHGLYHTNRLFFTHAWLPQDRFDEVLERRGWIFARCGQAYLALYSRQPYHWQESPGEDCRREVIAPGGENIWICELGRRAVDGEFHQFVERIARARLETGRLEVRYHSPSQGELTFGWRSPLRRNGETVRVKDYPRYDNPYIQAPFPAEIIHIRHGQHWLKLDWPGAGREASGYA